MKTRPLMEEIASDANIQQAFDWLCKRRWEYSADNDVWNLRRRWALVKTQLQAESVAGDYHFSAQYRFRIQGSVVELWAASDALVLKAMAVVLCRRLLPELSDRSFHLAGRGGAKAAVRAVAENLPMHAFVFRSDIKSYYASIDHDILLDIMQTLRVGKRVLKLLQAWLRRTVQFIRIVFTMKSGRGYHADAPCLR